ncbi:MAG: hypothetical protein ACR2H2_06245 [Solirubrobacteraceae bacterium]
MDRPRPRPRPRPEAAGTNGNSYAALIKRLAPGEDAARVEAWMRAEHGTLDSIDPVHFARAVKTAVDGVRAAGPQAG